MSESLLCEHSGAVATLSFNRPEQRNALNSEVLSALRVRLVELGADENVRVVVLRGADEKAFCSGFDLLEMVDPDADRSLLVAVLDEMFGLGKPIVAAVQGYALAGGMGLAAACDIVIADNTAVFGLPEINVGLWPYVITIPLLYSLAPKVVLDLMMTGRRVDAAEAQRIGFVSRVVDAAQFESSVESLTTELATKPRETMRIGRDSFYGVLDDGLERNFKPLLEAFDKTLENADAKEGIAAFREKRLARFS